MSNEIFADFTDVMTAEQLASALQISKSGAYALLNRSDFPTLRIGGRKMVMKKDLLEWLNSRTNSKKVKASMKQKGESGEYLTTNPPYGYMKDPDNPKKHWIIDDEAAAIVQRIFAWCMEGYGPSQIAHKLKAAKVD